METDANASGTWADETAADAAGTGAGMGLVWLSCLAAENLTVQEQ